MINSGISLRPACAVVAALCVMSGAVWGSSVSAERLLALAELGDARAQYAFADRLAKGDGVEQSWQLAADWYLLAAEQGHPEAQHALGVLFIHFGEHTLCPLNGGIVGSAVCDEVEDVASSNFVCHNVFPFLCLIMGLSAPLLCIYYTIFEWFCQGVFEKISKIFSSVATEVRL